MNKTSEGHASSVRILKDVAELKRLAEAATPGPWKSAGSKVQKGSRNICSHVNAGESLSIGLDVERGVANAAYIAAANPAAILELLAQRDELLAALQSAIKTAESENHPYRDWRSEARAAIAKATP